jgi:hypothetical protein
MDVGHVDKHEQMLNDMHDALHQLGNKIRKPYSSGSGDKLLPKALRPSEPAGASAARAHIARLHKGMRGGK